MFNVTVSKVLHGSSVEPTLAFMSSEFYRVE